MGEGGRVRYCGLPTPCTAESIGPLDFRTATEEAVERCPHKTAHSVKAYNMVPRIQSVLWFPVVRTAVILAFVVASSFLQRRPTIWGAWARCIPCMDA
ncbi:hypothetical protein N656DRAFT_361663 [Canariomyces notabilis]|uniref:Uncharacterized protein n=1 Tax=Canariomyces notabilis TaxID=2074819 RepID=A0AAN6QM44_9PEZI|nr:hypothetical protein N656DRAFT_361663 [Canariomyces arenarius]